MKNAIIAGLLGLILLIHGGCGKKGLSGTYQDSSRQYSMAFTDDGQFSGSYHGSEFHGFRGTYTLEGNKVTLTLTDMDNKKPEGKQAEPQTATLSDDGKTLTPSEGPSLTKS